MLTMKAIDIIRLLFVKFIFQETADSKALTQSTFDGKHLQNSTVLFAGCATVSFELIDWLMDRLTDWPTD